MNEITQEYQYDQSFHNQMDEAEKKYKSNLQRAFYTTFSKEEQQMLKFGGYDQEGDAIYLIFAIRQQVVFKNTLEKYYMRHISIFQEFLNTKPCKFTIIYFNTFCNTTQYNSFRSMYRSFPLKYFERLKRVLVIHPTFMLKALDWLVFGTVNRYLRSHTEYLDKIQDLKGYKIKVEKQLLDRIGGDIKQTQFALSKNSGYEQKMKNTRSNISHVQRIDKIVEKSREVDIHKLIEEENSKKDPTKRKITDYQISDIGVPILLKMMIMYLKMRPDFLELQGIFRKSVSIDDEQEAISYLYFGKYQYLQELTNPHIIASLIKKFLANLIQPLFPFAIYDELIHDPSVGKNISTLKTSIKKLPTINYITLMFLLDFFLKQIIPRQKTNKMTFYNVAVVLLPCLLRSKKNAIQDLMYSKKLVIVVESILHNYTQIFGNQNQQTKVYRESVKQNQVKFQQQSLSGSIQKANKKTKIFQKQRLQPIHGQGLIQFQQDIELQAHIKNINQFNK